MEKDDDMRKYLNVVIIAALLMTTLYATQVTKKIEVAVNTISVMVNGEKVEADNIVHDGTTYVPLRAISEMLDKEVIWTEETKIAEINDKNVKQDVVKKDNPVALMTMENGGEVKFELYPEIAPITVENFLKLIEEGFYDGITFHRAVPGFMVQGGDPMGTGMGGSGEEIKGEFAKNGVKNDLSHTRGVLSMARSQNPDSASSQFFIVVGDSQFLDGQYAGFGKVIEGMDVMDKIVKMPTDGRESLVTPQVIKTIKIVK